jgi:hypothetical protein
VPRSKFACGLKYADTCAGGQVRERQGEGTCRTACGVPSVATRTKAGPASRKEAGDNAPPRNKARDHVIKATTVHAHGLACKRGGAPAAGGGTLLVRSSRMRKKKRLCAKDRAPYAYSQRVEIIHKN